MTKKKQVDTTIVRGGATDEYDITEGMSLFQLADLYGKLSERKAMLMADPVFTRFAEVESKLKAKVASSYNPEDSVEIRGKLFTVTVGAAALAARTVKSGREAMKIMGEAMFFRLAKITVKDIEKHLTSAQAEKLILPGDGYIEARREIEVKKREMQPKE
jgi:hypothetical protein